MLKEINFVDENYKIEDMLFPKREDEVTFYQAGEGIIYYLTAESYCLHHIQGNHIIAFVYCGTMVVNDGINDLVVTRQNCAFLGKNHLRSISFHRGKDKTIKAVLIVLRRNKLLDLYQHIGQDLLNPNTVCNSEKNLKISSDPNTESFFLSLVPYIDAANDIVSEIMDLKIREIVYCLLHAQKTVAPVLFDFKDPWKIDILEFLNKNLTYNFTLKDLAQYTGRSVTTFKRDFGKISDLSPQKWILKKRLELANVQLSEGRNVSDIYLDLGFSSLSHFSAVYKKEFGVSPSKDRKSSDSVNKSFSTS